jgi:hypothetical protein
MNPSARIKKNTAIQTKATPSIVYQEFGDVSMVERLFGVKRTRTFELLRQGVIKSVLLGGEGSKRGRRLIHLPSVREFLMKKMKNQ